LAKVLVKSQLKTISLNEFFSACHHPSFIKISTTAPKNIDKTKTKQQLIKLLDELDELQNLLYAQHKYSVLIIIQGMDASGKDGLIRKVFGHLNPQGVIVQSFKEPTEEELSHDFFVAHTPLHTIKRKHTNF